MVTSPQTSPNPYEAAGQAIHLPPSTCARTHSRHHITTHIVVLHTQGDIQHAHLEGLHQSLLHVEQSFGLHLPVAGVGGTEPPLPPVPNCPPAKSSPAAERWQLPPPRSALPAHLANSCCVVLQLKWSRFLPVANQRGHQPETSACVQRRRRRRWRQWRGLPRGKPLFQQPYSRILPRSSHPAPRPASLSLASFDRQHLPSLIQMPSAHPEPPAHCLRRHNRSCRLLASEAAAAAAATACSGLSDRQGSWKGDDGKGGGRQCSPPSPSTATHHAVIWKGSHPRLPMALGS